ncbi:uncharacterized protein Z520_10513 [Fonsecaea multimorphosa CBS 102226]|uniref:FAD-binding domain-containing protein n=1 Tax=Fonsecaea multimorphosa CBS 102226 TaxID=1442371 RepID=A0A0D2KBC6_9EURO|nr:uncharacterized protein Z520_10513 [Fonsecaea multimorphosa CBS 102226]KIX93888.1 hypothetical protein Z520_10513 [Fonsecaea multimorphosa CBS 102226]OAL19125.1 hypothetical protein AYO22_10073 [Fonsecaea multimorphosa]
MDVSPSSHASSSSSVAIIGAGLTGLSITLSLLHHHLYNPSDIAIYDLRHPDTPDPANSSGVVLTPNGLRVLDSLGVLPRISSRCWLSEYRTYKNERDETTRKTLITNETLYGYKNHRLWRRILVETMLGMVRERGVRVCWGARFEGVVSEGEEGVTFNVDGRVESAGMLIGADGIHSSVRKYVNPDDPGPEYTGIAGVLSHIPWTSVEWPYENYERACTIQGRPGALVLMPEDREGSIVMVAMQVSMEDRSRDKWEALAQDKDYLRDFYANTRDKWESPTAKGIIDAVCRRVDTTFLWPFMRMAPLKKWYSEKAGRVIIMGDASHALPPSSGQGVNQALEDVYALTRLLLLLKSKPRLGLKNALAFWQSLRQARVDAVFDWATNKTNIQRLPLAEREALVREGKVVDASNVDNFDDMRWLYQPDTDGVIDAWAAQQA